MGGDRTLCLSCLHDLDAELPCDPGEECEQCDHLLGDTFNMIPDAYFARAVRSALYKEALRKGAADYVPRSCISVTVNNIPKAFMVRFVEEASEASRSTEHEPRALGHFNAFFVFFLLFFPNWHEQDTRRQPDSLGPPVGMRRTRGRSRGSWGPPAGMRKTQ